MLDHVAILVRSIESALPRLADLGATVGEIESFPSEGTREAYIGDDGAPGRILLLEPIGDDGPYARAMNRRGPGLHHLAYRVTRIEDFLAAHPGWLLHPISLQTRERSGTVWCARPGIPTLLEVFESPDPLDGTPLITRVDLPVPDALTRLTAELHVEVGPPAIHTDAISLTIQAVTE